MCSSSTDLAVPLISRESQSQALRNNKTCVSVVRPLLSLTMCASQKSLLFLQLIISSIHTRQRVCGSAALQRAIYHLSRQQKLKKHAGDKCTLHALKVYSGLKCVSNECQAPGGEIKYLVTLFTCSFITILYSQGWAPHIGAKEEFRLPCHTGGGNEG